MYKTFFSPDFNTSGYLQKKGSRDQVDLTIATIQAQRDEPDMLRLCLRILTAAAKEDRPLQYTAQGPAEHSGYDRRAMLKITKTPSKYIKNS